MGDPSSSRLPAEVSPIKVEMGETPLDLDSLAQQLFAIADRLRQNPQLYRDDRSKPFSHDAPEDRPAAAHQDQSEARTFNRRHFAKIARSIYDDRRSRDTIFESTDLFGEPAWDILLDLYIAEVEGKAVSVSSACIGSASPSTTGLRWLGVLTETGLVAREHDPEDQRRVLVRLSTHGLEKMDRFFEKIGSAS